MILRAFLRIFFHLLYHQLAWAYDLVAWCVSFGQWTAWARAVLPYLRGRRVLELAHGPGHLLAAMSRAGFAPVGLDLSPQMGQLARRRTRGAGLAVPLVRARAQALPFRSGSLDAVVSTFPTEFIAAPETLREIARVMGPVGRAVVVPGVEFRTGLAARALAWLYTVTGQGEPAPPGLAEALAEAGLSLEHERVRVGLADVRVAVAGKEK